MNNIQTFSSDRTVIKLSFHLKIHRPLILFKEKSLFIVGIKYGQNVALFNIKNKWC